MAIRRLNRYPNFSFEDSHWGTAVPGDITAILESCINTLTSHQDSRQLPKVNVDVDHITYDAASVARASVDPIWYPGDRIYLNCTDMHWCKYIYQFSHELCHHIISKPSIIIDNFGWLEESLCELASLFVLKKSIKGWEKFPPYPNWAEYSKVINIYFNDIITNKKYDINQPFKLWLQGHLADLYGQRYDRIKNTIIARALLKVFFDDPSLWQCVQYYKGVNCALGGITTLNDFLNAWRAVLPNNLKKKFEKIVGVLI